MAIRKKKDTTTTTGAGEGATPPKKITTKKRASTKKAAPATKKKRTPTQAVEELQTVGADVVPSVTLEVDSEAASLGDVAGVTASADAKLSEGGPIPADPDPISAVPAAEAAAAPQEAIRTTPAAIREHTVEQIQPEADGTRPESL